MSSIFLDTLHLKGNSQVPLWLMRQAGRYLPEYRAIRADVSDFMELCFNPKLSVEVTMQPIRRFDFDAAILFSDILVIPHALGQNVRFEKGEGPVLGDFDVNHLTFDVKKLNPVFETVRGIRENLDESKALIGFSGAPWTLATYMIEKGSSRDFEKTKRFALENKKDFEKLMAILVESISNYLCLQVESGAQALQIFDTWAGVLPHLMFDDFVIKPTKKIIENVRLHFPHIPIIGFPKGSNANLKKYVEDTKVNGISLDGSVHLKAFESDFQNLNVVSQGNLDPHVLLAGGSELERHIDFILKNKPKHHIFNLGHGILPQTPIEHVEFLVSKVRSSF